MVQLLIMVEPIIMRASSLHSLDTASLQEYGGHVGVVPIIAIASYFNNGQQRYTSGARPVKT